MFKIAFLTLALCAAVLAETSFDQVPFYSRVIAIDQPGFETTHPAPVKVAKTAGTYAVPPDTGGNYGDNLWFNRAPGDALLSREVLINPASNTEQAFSWTANFPNRKITHIRFLNIGRERAWVENISANGGLTANARILAAGTVQFRLLVEVFGE